MNEFGVTLQWLIEKKGLERPEDLARLLDEISHPVSTREIRECMEGSRWVDWYFPGQVARVLKLDMEEMGELARAVAYGQTGTTKSSS